MTWSHVHTCMRTNMHTNLATLLLSPRWKLQFSTGGTDHSKTAGTGQVTDGDKLFTSLKASTGQAGKS